MINTSDNKKYLEKCEFNHLPKTNNLQSEIQNFLIFDEQKNEFQKIIYIKQPNSTNK